MPASAQGALHQPAPAPSPAGVGLPSGASLSDLLTAVKNLVLAVNALNTTITQINGQSTTEAITVPTVVKSTPGRVASVSVIIPGSAAGVIYDANALGVTTAPLWIIPNAYPTNGEPYTVNVATNSGIVVVPGTGQSVTVNWA